MAILPGAATYPSHAFDVGRSVTGPGAEGLEESSGSWLALAVHTESSDVLTRLVYHDRLAAARFLEGAGLPGSEVLYPTREYTSSSAETDVDPATHASRYDEADHSRETEDGAALMTQSKLDARAASRRVLVHLDLEPVSEEGHGPGRDLDAPDAPGTEIRLETGQVLGPSAGLVMTLALLDARTTGDLTGGNTIAATGEVSPTGAVWGVGGVAAKAELAAIEGADLLLVAEHDREEAEAALARLGKDVKVAAVHTVEDAVHEVCQLPRETSELPVCEAAKERAETSDLKRLTKALKRSREAREAAAGDG